jgi:transposase
MEVLWLKAHGLPHAKIAELADITENTVRDYFELYQAGGTEKLKEVNFYRPESQLCEHITSLEAYFRENPPASIKEAQSEIEALTGIKRSQTQVREFLKKNSICVVGKSG